MSMICVSLEGHVGVYGLCCGGPGCCLWSVLPLETTLMSVVCAAREAMLMSMGRTASRDHIDVHGSCPSGHAAVEGQVNVCGLYCHQHHTGVHNPCSC